MLTRYAYHLLLCVLTRQLK